MEGRLPDANDVAAAIIRAAHNVDQFKLHKLLYYAQAWYLAWYDEPLFDGVIEAWRYGPYVPRVGRFYGGEEGVGAEVISEPVEGDPQRLDERRTHALESVIEAYDALSGRELAELTKTERPWYEARRHPPPHRFGRDPIPESVMKDYFRHQARFGPWETTVRISPDTLVRVRLGDRAAIMEGLIEAASRDD